MKIVVFTLGCKVNECESDSLIHGLKQMGHTVSDKLEIADLYIVNTCAITADAEKKSRQTSARVKRLNPNAKIIYTGCATQKNPESFLSKPNASLVTGVFQKDKILSMLDGDGLKMADFTTEYEELPPARTLKDRSLIKVQDGCDNFCSYCIVPYLRGRSRSRKIESVVNEVKGVTTKELVINGINLSSYSDGDKTLTDLISALSFTDVRIRLGSLEARVIDDGFLTALKNLKNFAPHFHLSLQSGSTSVLKK
jgi:threonylcarbamoyladenosine tRNA methylthiotransferase MtaB